MVEYLWGIKTCHCHSKKKMKVGLGSLFIGVAALTFSEVIL